MDLAYAEEIGDFSIALSSSQYDDLHVLERMDTAELLPSSSSMLDLPAILYQFEPPNKSDICAYRSDVKPLAYAALVDHQTKMPQLDELTNHLYNFNVVLKGMGRGSAAWCYSEQLQKLYGKKEKPVTVDVSYRNSLPGCRLTLRIMLICSEPHEVHVPISRCQHDISKDKALEDPLKEHIVRCVNPAADYIGNAAGVVFKDRLAMVIPLYGVGEQVNTPVSLEFLCQNSCPTIRRPTSLVFTLENEQGAIVGRKLIGVKICSCPKRDMDKDKDKEEGKEGKEGDGRSKRKHNATRNSTSSAVDQQEPPRKLTRQSSRVESTSGAKSTRSVTTQQRDSPVPSSSKMCDSIKKETTTTSTPLSRSSSTISNATVENDSTAIVLSIRLPDIATAVEVAEYAFKHISSDMVRCKDTEKGARLAKFLHYCGRTKSKYSQFL